MIKIEKYFRKLCFVCMRINNITRGDKVKKARLNKKYIMKLAFRCTTIFFSILGFVGTFVPLNNIIPSDWRIEHKILLSVGILIFVFGLCWCGCVYWFESRKWIKVFDANNDCHVYVQYGDVFSENEVDTPNQRRNIIIPVNRCFDTIVDDDLISSRTLHGIAFKKLYYSGKYDENSLNIALQNDLNIRQKLVSEKIGVNEKRKGNLKRYDFGTIAEIKGDSNCTYFFLALSTFDCNLSAHATQEEYVLTMQKMLEYCCSRSQGFPIVMPLIGAGQSRTGNNERSILEYIVGLLKMNKDLIMSDIHIVVRNSGRETISITEL